MLVNILLIRHGETDSNKKKIIMGHLNVPLNSNGIEQAKSCGKYLKKIFPNISAIYSSTLLRAQETITLVVKELNFEASVKYDTSLTERSFGELEGLSVQDVYSRLLNESGNYDVSIKPPNGESGIDFYKRVSDGIENIINDKSWDKDGTILVLTHGGTIRHILGYLLYDKNNEYNDFPVDAKNCSLTLLSIDKNVENRINIKFMNFYQYLVN